MFTSLKSKIISLIIFIMVVTAVIIIFISSKEIGNAMLVQQNSMSRNVLSLIELNIKGEYSNLISDKIYSVTRHKNRLNSRKDQLIELLDRLNLSVEQQVLSKIEAQQIAFDWVKNNTSETHETLFITDMNLHVIAHPHPDTIGYNIGSFTDIKINHFKYAGR